MLQYYLLISEAGGGGGGGGTHQFHSHEVFKMRHFKQCMVEPVWKGKIVEDIGMRTNVVSPINDTLEKNNIIRNSVFVHQSF